MSSASPPEGSPGSSSPSSPVNASHGSHQHPVAASNAPKYGTLVPNRIFVGGISGNTTESELAQLFSAYGNVKATKVISDRAGVSKGYGFVTFETAEEASRLMAQEGDGIVLKERKLNIAPAIKKQPFSRSYEVASPPAVHGNTIFYQNGMPYTFHNGVAYFASAPTPHGAASAGGDPAAIYPVCVPATAAAAYVPQVAAAAAAAAAHTPPATYPILYPCTAQPIYMSQQFQYPALPAQSSHQFIYTGPATSASPAAGPAAVSVASAAAGPPGSQCQPQPTAGQAAVAPAATVHLTATPAAAHYYGPMPSAHAAPTAGDPTGAELYYSVTPVHPAAHPYATTALYAATPDGFLFETQPITESSSNHSPEDSSSSSSRSEVGQTRCVQRDSDCSGTRSQDGSCPPIPPAPASAPPVVSLLKLQQQHHQQQHHHHQQQQPQHQQPPQPVVPLQTCDDSNLGPPFRQLPAPSHVMYGAPVFFNHHHHHHQQQQRSQPAPPVPYRQPRMRRPQYRREPPSLSAPPIRQNGISAGAGPPGPRYGFPATRRGPGVNSSSHRRTQSPPSAHTPPPLPYSPLNRSRGPFLQPVPTPSNQFQGVPPRPTTTYFHPSASASGSDAPRRYGARKSGPSNGSRYTGGGGPKSGAAAATVATPPAAVARAPLQSNSCGDDRGAGDGPTVVPLPSQCSNARASPPCDSEATVITAPVVDSTHEVCRELQALTV